MTTLTNSFEKGRMRRMHEVLSAHVHAGALPGLVALVSHRGETRVDAIGLHATGGSTAAGNRSMQHDTIFRIASMTKPVVAAAAMLLVEACRLRLDDSVDEWLPELANRRVLKRIDGPLDDTVPAQRAITLRDLLTFRAGYGFVMAAPTAPIQLAIRAADLAPGPKPPSFGEDAFMRRLGSLPLAHQPGEQWLYHTGSDILGVLIARASGKPLATFLHDQLFEPLGMHDTGFYVPTTKLHRLPPTYMAHPESGELMVHDAAEGRWSERPAFASGGGGLVSTAHDYHAFLRMLISGGRVGSERLLARASVALMTSNHLTKDQRRAAALFLGETNGWGFGGAVCLARHNLWDSPGRYGWDGGMGTSAHMDPVEDVIGVLLTQRLMDSPTPPPVFTDFWTSVYQALGD